MPTVTRSSPLGIWLASFVLGALAGWVSLWLGPMGVGLSLAVVALGLLGNPSLFALAGVVTGAGVGAGALLVQAVLRCGQGCEAPGIERPLIGAAIFALAGIVLTVMVTLRERARKESTDV